MNTELKTALEQGCWHEDENPLEAILPVGYDQSISEDVRMILALLRAEPIGYSAIADRLKLDVKYVHLILEVLAAAGLTEYGTSPRCSWLTPKGEELLELTETWKARQTAQ